MVFFSFTQYFMIFRFSEFFRNLKITGHFPQFLSAQRFWSFQRQTKSSAPDHLTQASQSPGNTKQNGIILHLGHTVVLKENTRVSIYVWPWVLSFTLSQKNIWNKFVDLSDQFKHIVIWQVFQSKFSLTSVPWIGLSKNGVAVAWNNSSRFQGVPDEVVEFFIGDILTTEIFSELGEPYKDFLVGKTVEWASETVHSGSKGQVWIGEG